jgi:zinc D-Ala-D-Ala carboxypeptidase
MKLKHFTHAEFDSPDKPGSGANMDADFLEMLDQARERCGFAFKINSGYRTVAHNRAVKGVPNSSHLRGMAADIACSGSRERFHIVRALLSVGFDRIGIGRTFIHVDNDPAKSEDVIWHYYK